MTFVVSQATVFLFGIRMNKLFLLGACLCAGTCLAQSGFEMKSYRIVNQSNREISVSIKAPKMLHDKQIVQWNENCHDLSANSDEVGEIESTQDELLNENVFAIAATDSENPALVALVFCSPSSFKTFRSPNKNSRITCVIDQNIKPQCTFQE